jgi:hypothetical protein
MMKKFFKYFRNIFLSRTRTKSDDEKLRFFLLSLNMHVLYIQWLIKSAGVPYGWFVICRNYLNNGSIYSDIIVCPFRRRKLNPRCTCE